MNTKKSIRFRSVCIYGGCILIVFALILLILWQISIYKAAETNAKNTASILELIPNPEAAVLESRNDNKLPILSISGTDYVGILEFPAYDSILPVQANWNKALPSPAVYEGSIYDRSMIIGATTQYGQYSFFRNINVSDILYFTDMTGNQYAYTISDILYRDHADNESLHAENADLTLFIKNIYSFEYIILYCNAWH